MDGDWQSDANGHQLNILPSLGMASVNSLDHDVRNLRLSRYTPQAANEIRAWIEDTLGTSLPAGDLLDALKDGVALCKLANLVLSAPGIKFKQSSMPFIQMENISHFLKACEMSPLNMPAHDRFLTVDLYEAKDPAQVLQCLTAFSRQAHAARPDAIRTTIGPKKSSSAMSPPIGNRYSNGGPSSRSASPTKSTATAMSPALTGGSARSERSATAVSPPSAVSSWSKRVDETATTPAWNIAQYGYMGGASQGNQGISFGARRQITSQPPSVPSLAEKERLRKEKALEEGRRKAEERAASERQREQQAAEERLEKEREERRWEEETRRLRDEERRRLEEQKRQWAEQERKWKEDEEARRKADQNFALPSTKPPLQSPRVDDSGILRGQSLSEYRREQDALSKSGTGESETPEQKRVKELERQLEEARERERQYLAEREMKEKSRPSTARTEASRPASVSQSQASWTVDDSEAMEFRSLEIHDDPVTLGAETRTDTKPTGPQVPLPRPLPLPQRTTTGAENNEPVPSLPPTVPSSQMNSSRQSGPQLGASMRRSPFAVYSRPLPTPEVPATRTTNNPPLNRVDRFLATEHAPEAPSPRVSSTQETGDAALEQSSSRDTRLTSQQKTKAGGWASKSLLEREMERERERQREWEANQATVRTAPRDSTQGSSEGKSWDVNQYGYVGGDSMNRGSSAGSGINFGGRRQILGPRSMGGGGKRDDG